MSTKFKAICKDQDVCEKININDKNVSNEDIQFIFEEKCKNFQLQFATLERDLILTKISEVNLESTSITRTQSIYLVRNLTPKLKKINLGVLSLTDEHIKALVKRCNKLQELKLNNSGPITDNAITSIIDELKNTLETLDLPSYKEIYNSKLLELGEMPKLMNLNIDRPKSEIQRLRIQLPNLYVNEVYPFM